MAARKPLWKRAVRPADNQPGNRTRRRPRSVTVAMIVIAVAVVLAVAVRFYSPHDPTSGNLSAGLMPPAWLDGGSWAHPLGTDRAGRDLLTRILFGMGLSIFVAVLCAGLLAIIAVPVAVVSGYFGGATDGVIQRGLEATLAIPGVMIALVLAVAVGPSLTNVIVIVLITQVARIAIPLRADVVSVRRRQFVQLAETANAGHLHIKWRHILPHVRDMAVVLLTLEVGQIILLEAALSFLGVGIPPPTPSLGSIISEGLPYMTRGWWISLFPGLVLTLLIVATNLVGDWLRDKWDPKINEVTL